MGEEILMNPGYIIMTAFSGLAIWLGMLLLLSALFKWLWNTTITRIFNLREITYWESFRLMMIAALIFGNGPGFNFRV